MQFADGVNVVGAPIAQGPYTDAWDLRPGNDPGFTCCELSELSNKKTVDDVLGQRAVRQDLAFAALALGPRGGGGHADVRLNSAATTVNDGTWERPGRTGRGVSTSALRERKA
jgi:hypothetical protein